MTKFVKKVLDTGPLGLTGILGDDKSRKRKDEPTPDELAAEADAAEKRRRRSALGRESTITSGTLGSPNVGASLLSGK